MAGLFIGLVVPVEKPKQEEQAVVQHKPVGRPPKNK